MKRYAIVYTILVLVFFAAGLADAGTLVDNGNGAISDQGTQLMWQRQDDGTTRTWTAAITYCEDLILAGYTNWRLPTVTELYTISDLTIYNPAINTTYFTGAQAAGYWSSTTLPGVSTRALIVDFNNGSVSYSDKTGMLYVRCVR